MNPPAIWRRLRDVRSAAFDVLGNDGPRHGEGTVSVHAADPHTLEWEELGRSTGADGRALPYRDRIRWQWHEGDALLSLHHLRHGEEHPVHLGDLAVTAAGGLEPRAPHLCGDDSYVVRVEIEGLELSVEWTVTGPKKSYTLRRRYR